MNTNLHLQTIKSIPVPMYAPCIFEGAFGDVELRRLRKQVETFPEEEALTHGDSMFGSSDEDSERIAKQKGIPQIEDFAWLYSKFESLCMQANYNFKWNFEMTGMFEPAIYLTYDGKVKGKYNSHMDVGGDGPMSYRKISATLLVNDDYEGGELVFQGAPKPDKDTPKLKAGTIIFFPSFMMHSVEPVTKGIRNSVVLWLHGKPYK